MVADTVRRGSSANGLQRLNLARHWRQVVDLIETAFGEALDIEARRALHSMRLPSLLAPLIVLLDSLSAPGEGMMPGFVWLESGRVVGTASVRRLHSFSQGWLISNVAVHPEWQGRGIGRVLLEASLDYTRDYGGAWVVLQVRDSNFIARQLYESLGFRSICEVVRLRRLEAGDEPIHLSTKGLRPARWSEGRALARLARTLTSYDVLWADLLNPDLYRTGPLSRLREQLYRRRRQWWVYDESSDGATRPRSSKYGLGNTLRAAVGIEVDPRTPWHRLRLLISPQLQDERLAARLIAFGANQLITAPPMPIEIEHPAPDKATQAALTDAGFEPIYASIHMRLDQK